MILVDDDFSSDTNANWNGPNITIAGGNATPTDDGLCLHVTPIPGDSWISIVVVDSSTTNIPFAMGDASGNGIGIVFRSATDNLDQVTQYDAYITYPGTDDNINLTLTGFAVGNRIGMTIDKTNHVLRFWNAPVANEPTSLTLWDGAAPVVSLTLTGLAVNTAVPGDYVGFGTWDTSSPADTFDNFMAGDFSTGDTLMAQGIC